MATSFSRAAPSVDAFTTRSPIQKLAMQAADQASCLSLTLKTHNKLDHMILPERESHPEHPCWIPVQPHFAELVRRFNDELVRQLSVLMQALEAMQKLMTNDDQGEEAKHHALIRTRVTKTPTLAIIRELRVTPEHPCKRCPHASHVE